MQKEDDNLDFVIGVNCELIESLNNNVTKYTLIFDNSFEKICNPKAFHAFATVGRHHGVRTPNIKHNFFHQNNLGRDVELQIKHIVFSQTHRDVMQISTLSANLGFQSELFAWYRDAASVPCGHFLIDFPQRTIDYFTA